MSEEDRTKSAISALCYGVTVACLPGLQAPQTYCKALNQDVAGLIKASYDQSVDASMALGVGEIPSVVPE